MSLKNHKLFTRFSIVQKADDLRALGQKIVFTNGCFDLLHPGHIAYLNSARQLGDFLIIGLNTDLSVRKLKGKNRPINDENVRAYMLAGLSSVDGVVFFDEDTPLELIQSICPAILVKGGDYTKDKIVGAAEVEAYGGHVEVIPFLEGYSTSAIIEKIKSEL
jgi:D-beta-D-heptose 7-phosphate kinase/D-beta-D-heptose 1-phosphate adenosyltransferase